MYTPNPKCTVHEENINPSNLRVKGIWYTVRRRVGIANQCDFFTKHLFFSFANTNP